VVARRVEADVAVLLERDGELDRLVGVVLVNLEDRAAVGVAERREVHPARLLRGAELTVRSHDGEGEGECMDKGAGGARGEGEEAGDKGD
jgi:hypothetical protein